MASAPPAQPADASVKDFMTRRVLLRCDSTGDLYPVMPPSLVPHVFLVSQYMWHQRLGHPGRMISSISSRLESIPVLKHTLYPISEAPGKTCRYKTRLVANGSNQIEGVDVDETFSLVVKLGTIRTVLSLAASRHWLSHQLDVKNSFLHGDLSETVYMHQPSGFWDYAHPDYGIDTAYLLLYVDDIVLTASSEGLLQQIIGSLHQEFAMTDLGPLNYFLGIYVTRDSSGLFLSQKKLSSVSYFTRPDISYAVQQVCLHMHDLREPYLFALKRILRYVQSNLNYGLQLFASSTTDLVAYSDADWAPTLSRSSAEVEYRGVANVVAETCWLRNLLRELHTPLSSATLVYCDNVKVLHVLSRYQFADIFTKGLPSALFEEFRDGTFSMSLVKTGGLKRHCKLGCSRFGPDRTQTELGQNNGPKWAGPTRRNC
nr:hypothetical protein [Tanacetum cinerariifolium]